MYRPTVRYSEIYRTYVDAWFHASFLDRNQIIRCALFTAAHNPLFIELMNQYKKRDVTLPSPLWSQSDHQIWLEQEVSMRKIEEVNAYDVYRRKGTSTGTTQVPRTPTFGEKIQEGCIPLTQRRRIKEEKKEHYRRQQTSERRTGSLPTLQLNNNGGIRLDFR